MGTDDGMTETRTGTITMGATPLSVPIITEVRKLATEVWLVIGGIMVPTVVSIHGTVIYKSGPDGFFDVSGLVGQVAAWSPISR